MIKTLKPSYKFISSASYQLSRGATKEEIREFSKEFDITSERVEEFLKNQTLSKAVSGAVIAGKEEKELLYNILDQKFIEEYKDVVIFTRGENVSFYEYKNGVYIFLTFQDMYNYVDLLMSKYYLLDYRTSSRNVKDTIERVGSYLSRINKRHFKEEDLLDRKWYLNLKNGLLDMDTFKIKPHSSDYFSTVQVNYEYDSKTKCPKFDDFIKVVSGDNKSTAEMIQQMYGYSLMDGNPMHKVFYLYGDTARNGKSTTAKILCGLIGWGNVSTLSLQQIENENSSIATSIVGKQINFSDEISSKFIDSSRLTALAAEGIIEINPKYKRSFMYPVKAKFIIACNDLPRFNDYQGMKHRMISIPFRYHLKENERILRFDEILLKEEGSGILNWAIEGAKIIKKNNAFSSNDDSKEDLHDNLLQSYPVYAYLEMTYDFSPEYIKEFDPKSLYGESTHAKDSVSTGYRLFCEENNIRACSSFTFNRELKRFSHETGNIKQVRVGHRSDRRYIGLKSREEIDGDKDLEEFKSNAVENF